MFIQSLPVSCMWKDSKFHTVTTVLPCSMISLCISTFLWVFFYYFNEAAQFLKLNLLISWRDFPKSIKGNVLLFRFTTLKEKLFTQLYFCENDTLGLERSICWWGMRICFVVYPFWHSSVFLLYHMHRNYFNIRYFTTTTLKYLRIANIWS